MKSTALFALFVFLAASAVSQEVLNPVPSLRDQASIHQQWLAERLETVLPKLMREHDVHMWIVPMREYGDILHCDFGLTLMRLNTDTQHMGYVLRPGETDVPAGIRKILERSNRLQDILLENMKVGLSGNTVLANTLSQMRNEGINGTVYTHPLGEHGHGAGPLIGLWDRQGGVPGRGDVPILPNTWFSIELQATTPVAEWDGQQVQCAQEEDVSVDSTGAITWVFERQSQFHIIK